jgi:hypothetical protein
MTPALSSENERKEEGMSSTTMTPWGLLKSLFSKLCFGLGVCTLAYLSYSGIAGWISRPSTPVNQGGLQEKVSELTGSRPNALAPREMTSFGYSYPGPGAAPVNAIPPQEGGAAAPTPAPGLGTETAAQPSPSPGASEAQQAQSELDAMAADGSDLPAYAVPYGYESGYSPSEAPRQGERSSSETAPSNSNPNSPLMNTAMIASGSSSASGAQASAATPANMLNAHDLQLLETGMKALMVSDTLTVAGSVYGSGTASGSMPTGTTASTSISTTRWTWSEGLDHEATLSLDAPSANAITAHLSLRIQNASGAIQNAVATTIPLQTQVRSEFRGGHPFRVFSFTLANAVLSGRQSEGESATLKAVRLVLSFDVSSPNNPVMGHDSALTFTRSHAQMAASPWTTGPLGAGDPGVLADLVTYSMKVEKSP